MPLHTLQIATKTIDKRKLLVLPLQKEVLKRGMDSLKINKRCINRKGREVEKLDIFSIPHSE